MDGMRQEVEKLSIFQVIVNYPFAHTLLLSNAAMSLANASANLEISSQYDVVFTLWSFYLSSPFVSLQITEFRTLEYAAI